MIEPIWLLATAATLFGVTNANPAQYEHRADNLEAHLQQRGNSGAPDAFSPPHYPSPWMNPSADGWEAAYIQAKQFVSQMTLMEKVNLTTGVGYVPFLFAPN